MKRILIVEDETVLREYLAELLGEEGYEVLEADNGKAAHDLILRLSMRINTNRFSHRDWYKKAEGVTTTRAARSAGN